MCRAARSKKCSAPMDWTAASPKASRLLPASAANQGGAAGSDMMVDWQPGYRVFWRNLRDLISPPKLPPLKLTSKPVPVRPLWAKREEFSVAQGISIGVHALIFILILVPLARKIVQPTPTASARSDNRGHFALPVQAAGRQRQGGRRRWRRRAHD